MSSIEQIDVDKVLVGLKHAAATASNEEELRIRASGLLDNEVISKLGIAPGKHEYTFVSGGRLDALYGHVIIEYKAPGKLLREPDVARAKEQLIGYIRKEAEVEDRFKLFLGVILADRIAFVRYDEKTKSWLIRGPYDLNRETVLKFVEAIRGLRRKKLAVDELLRDFGPKSDTAIKMVNVFYGKVVSSKSPKVEALFNDWKRLFSQVCSYSPEKLKGLEAEYGLTGKVDYSALLFAVHTHYALVMKLLAAEVAYLFGAGKWLKSYVAELEDANMKGLEVFKKALEDMESGGVFRKLLNITNFIEGDYFSWYLEELDQETANKIADLAKRLADYEPATPILEPEYTRDLLKRLYQNLVPKKIRHDLGEYYTPDWLAELLLNEAGLTVEEFEKLAMEKNDSTKPLNLRILDPACGSGTFLILTIKRLREYAEEHYLKDVLSNYILNNVVGFDLNPLAVLTARTNYLLAIADLLTYAKGPIEIPVYLADSILVETRTTLTGVSYAIRPYVGTFELPKVIVDKGALSKLLEVLDRCVRLRYKPQEFNEIIMKDFGLSDNGLQLVGELYKTFLKLEEDGKNHVWTSIIKNAFAPLTIVSSYGRFDYVIGNPPWINWENLPESYRNETKKLWDFYGLLKKTKGMGLGKVKRDMAMLFLARCMDRYIKDDGELSFLIPFTTYKTQAGAGFRDYLTYKCGVLKVHDLVELFPFEGAINRTSLIVAAKGSKTTFPVPCVMWHNPRSEGIKQDAELEEIRRTTKQFDMILTPVAKGRPETPWMIITEKAKKAVENIVGESPWYRAYLGVVTAFNGVYWVNIMSKQEKELLVQNLGSGGKKVVSKLQAFVEESLVYPLIQGKNVSRWYGLPEKNYIIVPHDGKSGRPLAEKQIKISYPKTYSFLATFKKSLENRSLHKLWGRYNPFYSLYDIGDYTLTDYKVVWKRIAGGITGKAVDFASAVLEPFKGELTDRKPIVPNDSLILIPINEEKEAYYVSGVLNSSPVLFTIASYTYELRMETHITQYIKIPKFNPKEKLHAKISELSKQAHELAKKYYEQNDLLAYDELKKIEDEIDEQVSHLYRITDIQLKEIKKTLAILKGEEVEEETIEEEPLEVKVDFLSAVVSPNVAGSFEIAIMNPQKDRVKIELQLPDQKVELETDKEQENIKVKVPPLPIGEHKIPYKIITRAKVAEGEFTLYVKEKKRFRKDETLTSKLDELLGDKT